MAVFCSHCQYKFSRLDALNRHKQSSKKCQKNILKKKLIIDCNLKCFFDCCSKPFKSEASLLYHYKNYCVKITNFHKSILFPLSRKNINDNSSVISSSVTKNIEDDISVISSSFKKIIDDDCSVISSSYNEAVEISDSYYRSSAERILCSIGLQFHPQYGIFNCIECKSIVRKNYLDHSRRAHRMPLLNYQQKNTVSIFVNDLINSSPYFLKSNNLLEPINFIKIFDGFRCTNCPYYCKSEYSKQKHIKQHSRNTLMLPCKVQTIAGESSKKKIYFGVKDLLEKEIYIHKETNEAIGLLKLAKSKLFKQKILNSKLNCFYVKLGSLQLKESRKSLNMISIKNSEEIDKFYFTCPYFEHLDS